VSLADVPVHSGPECSKPPSFSDLPSTLNEALNTPALPPIPQVTPDEVHSALLAINTSPLRAATIAAVQAKQLDRQANMIRRWKGGNKTTTFIKGSHVSLSLPGALLHGVDVTRAPCMVLEEVRPQYYQLLHPLGILQGLHQPGNLQPLKGHTFPPEMQQAFETYEEGTVGSVSIGAVVRSLTGEWQIKLSWVTAHPQSQWQGRSSVNVETAARGAAANVRLQEQPVPSTAIVVSASVTTLLPLEPLLPSTLRWLAAARLQRDMKERHHRANLKLREELDRKKLQ
jgi:hypothetical protein